MIRENPLGSGLLPEDLHSAQVVRYEKNGWVSTDCISVTQLTLVKSTAHMRERVIAVNSQPYYSETQQAITKALRHPLC